MSVCKDWRDVAVSGWRRRVTNEYRRLHHRAVRRAVRLFTKTGDFRHENRSLRKLARAA